MPGLFTFITGQGLSGTSTLSFNRIGLRMDRWPGIEQTASSECFWQVVFA